MNDLEKFIRCMNARMNLDSGNNCIERTLWNCKQCPYDISVKKFIQYFNENRQYALQTTKQRIFKKN